MEFKYLKETDYAVVDTYICKQKGNDCGFGLLNLYGVLYFSKVLNMNNFKIRFSPPLNHYSNKQTVNPMVAMDLMYRLSLTNCAELPKIPYGCKVCVHMCICRREVWPIKTHSSLVCETEYETKRH